MAPLGSGGTPRALKEAILFGLLTTVAHADFASGREAETVRRGQNARSTPRSYAPMESVAERKLFEPKRDKIVPQTFSVLEIFPVGYANPRAEN